MKITYDPLWSLLNTKQLNKQELKNICSFSNTTIYKLSNNKNVSIEILARICEKLDCQINDLVRYIPEEDNQIKLFYNPKFNIKTSLNTLSFFSGAGGLDLGLSKSGFNIIFASDIYKPAIENYSYNIGNISEIDIKELNPYDLPDGDVVIGGFPCQPFSTAGNRLGEVDDRGNLYLNLINIINVKKPKIVIMENVRGLLSMKNKDGSLLIDTIVHLLENVSPGYNVTYKLLKASDYGVPQNRYRVIIIGIRSDLKFNYVFPNPIEQNIEELHVKNIINVPLEIPNSQEVWKLSPQSQELLKWIPEGGSWKSIPYEYLPERLKKIRDNMKKYRSPNFYRRFSRNEINGTITAAGTPENSGILHPIEDRRYSVREIARIQSFPDDYVFVGNSISAKYKIIGNAVPPKLAEVIGDSIIMQLELNNL